MRRPPSIDVTISQGVSGLARPALRGPLFLTAALALGAHLMASPAGACQFDIDCRPGPLALDPDLTVFKSLLANEHPVPLHNLACLLRISACSLATVRRNT